MKRALVTGASGFVGQWLCRALLRDGWQVTGISLTPPIQPAGVLGSLEASTHFVTADLRHLDVARDVVRLAAAEAVFHLAGQSFVPAPGKDPIDGFSSNVGACVSLLAALRDFREQGGNDPRVLVVGSAEQYGNCGSSGVPITETCPLRPATWYAGSKCAQEDMALAAFRADGLKTICTRSFNQGGPGQSQLFLLPTLVRQVVSLRERATAERASLRLGNLSTARDFLHVQDAVDAYVALLTRGTPGEVYNVCSGDGVTVETLAREVCARAGVDAELVSDATLRRAIDVPWLVGDNTKLRTTTGWTPRRTRTDIIDDLLHAASH